MAQTIDDIRADARSILIRLAFVSEAPTARMDAMPRSRGTPEHRRPTGEAYPEAEWLRDRLDRCTSVTHARAIVEEARRALAHATRRALPPDTTETAEELGDRIVEDGGGWTAEDVSLACRCTPSFVRRARLERGRDPETGYTPPDADPMDTARVLIDAGRSTRAVSALTGIPRSTLRYRFGQP